MKRTIQAIGLLTGPSLAVVLYVILPDRYQDSAGSDVLFTHAGRATMALMAWMAVWWLTEAIDISATSLLPIVVLSITGAATIKQATAPYGSDLIFLFMGGFILALSMQRWGLDRRIALLTLRIVGTHPLAMIGGFMIATAMLSAFVSNTATAAMMMPVGLGVIDLVLKQHAGATLTGHGLPDHGTPGRNFALCLMLGIAYAASIGGVATIIGTPPNVYLVGFLRDSIDPAYRMEISFLKWMTMGVPLVAVFLPITWFMLTHVLYPVRINRIEGGREFIDSAYRKLGPMNAGERATLIVFLCATVLWITRPWLSAISVGSGNEMLRPFAGLTDAGIAILAALALFVIPVRGSQPSDGSSNSILFVMNWAQASKLPWGILILFGGGLSLAAAIESNGVAEFIGAQTHRFAGVPPLVLVIVVTAAVIFFSELASNTATATTLVPILAAMAPALDVHPYMLVIPAAIAASCAFMMPVGTPPNAIVFGTGYVTMAQMIKAGFWLNIIGIVLITALMYTIAMRALEVP